jgi:putative glutamine amidotransferase
MAEGQPHIVGIPCCRKFIGGLPYHAVGEKYIDAARDVAHGLPLLVPITQQPLDPQHVLASLDGLLLTGSVSNVAPHHYGGVTDANSEELDTQRDATTLPLIVAALERGLPVLAICRGMQELNVALGGTLVADVHKLPGRFDHKGDEAAPEGVRYGPRHDVELVPGGVLDGLLERRCFAVNSLHGQAIDRLAEPLAVEARAPDGTIEAVSMPAAKGFAVGVQWHPEWRAAENPISRRLFEAFGAALDAGTSGAGRRRGG